MTYMDRVMTCMDRVMTNDCALLKMISINDKAYLQNDDHQKDDEPHLHNEE